MSNFINMNVFHILVKSISCTENGPPTPVQTHYVAIADRPSRAIAILEESLGWRSADKITVEMASPQSVAPDMQLTQEAVWRI